MSSYHLFFDPRRDHSRRVLTLLSCSIASLMLSGCGQKPEAPKPERQAASSTNTAVIIADTPATLPPEPKAVQQLDVPIYVEGSSLLLHPLVTLYTDDKGLMAQNYSSANKTTSNFITQINRFDYTSNIDNLILENLETGMTRRVFAHNGFHITRVFFPYALASTPKAASASAKTAKPKANQTANADDNATLLLRILYEVDEAPADKNATTTQRNKRIRLALYMTDNSGNGLTRLHPNNQFLLSSSWVEPLKRFYFVTRADSDNNGKLDDKDEVYYYYLDFNTDTPVIRGYRFAFN